MNFKGEGNGMDYLLGYTVFVNDIIYNYLLLF